MKTLGKNLSNIRQQAQNYITNGCGYCKCVPECESNSSTNYFARKGIEGEPSY